jgi:uncharacterized membrane protein
VSGETPVPDAQRSSDQVLVHFYRAVVGHADAWRQRMDATTNWAAATTAGMISVSFSATAPHFVLLLALAFDTMFLFMESRRYQIYDLWRRRVQWLNRYYISPALSSSPVDPEVTRAKLDDLAADLGRTVPHLSLSHAIGYRIQRNYGYLFGVALLAWMLKLSMHPQSGDPEVVLESARVGILPGATVVALVVAFVLGAALLALRAPSDKMVGWEEAPSRLRRWRERRRPPPGKELEGDDVPPPPLEH